MTGSAMPPSRMAAAGGGAQDFGSFSDIFENIFGEFMNGAQGGQRSNVLRGSDLRYDLEVSLEDAFHGKTIELKIDTTVACEPCDGSGATPGTKSRTCTMLPAATARSARSQGFFVVERTCPTCHGRRRGDRRSLPDLPRRGPGREAASRSTVNVPAGVDEGTRIRLPARARRARAAGRRAISTSSSMCRGTTSSSARAPPCSRACPISFTTAALGGSIDVPGLDGERHEIRIPAGIQSGKQLRQRGAGMPVLNGRGHGDMVIQIEVETPTKLSARQKELLRAVPRDRDRRRMPGLVGLLRQAQDGLGRHYRVKRRLADRVI